MSLEVNCIETETRLDNTVKPTYKLDMIIKKCPICLKEYKARRQAQKVCSHKCRYKNIALKRIGYRKGNKYIIGQDYSLIWLGPTFHVKFDNNDLDRIKLFTWSLHKSSENVFYVRTRYKKGKTIRLHRYILGVHESSFPIVDHINNDTLDNRKMNLRLCSVKDNIHNQKGSIKTSKYKGVYLHTQTKRWVAQCKGIHIGCFKNEVDAARAYNKKAIELYGEYAYLNKALPLKQSNTQNE